ncbi:MAG: hypothetical protein ACKVVT_05035 [Dehalococcoidia bacterium]
MDPEALRICGHCAQRYSWRRSTSRALKMTFCTALCERGALGFTLETLLLSPIRVLKPEWRTLLQA